MRIRGDICLMIQEWGPNRSCSSSYTRTGKGRRGAHHQGDLKGEMALEAGSALVLADRGICAIELFRIVRPFTKFMEQQTVRIAKAGILWRPMPAPPVRQQPIPIQTLQSQQQHVSFGEYQSFQLSSQFDLRI